MAPIQCRFISLTKDAESFLSDIKDRCIGAGIRFDFDNSSEKLGYKIRKAQLEKIPLVAIIGEKELQEKKLTIRCRDSKNQPILTVSELIQQIKENKI